MARPYSAVIREQALARADAGETVRVISEKLHISPSCLSKWEKLRSETGSLSPGKMNGHKKRVMYEVADWLRERLRSGPFTLRKLTMELAARGIKTDLRAVWIFVHAVGMSFRENHPADRAGSSWYGSQTNALEGPSRQDRSFAPSLYRRDLDQNQHGPSARLGAKRQSLQATAPYGHWKTMTFIAALRHDRISAPWVYRRPYQRRTVHALCGEGTRANLAEGDIVTRNLGSHKGKPARDAIRAKGAHRFFLPPYSPDLIRSSRSSPVTGCRHEISKRHGERSANSSASSQNTNAQTTSKTPVMFLPKNNMLSTRAAAWFRLCSVRLWTCNHRREAKPKYGSRSDGRL